MKKSMVNHSEEDEEDNEAKGVDQFRETQSHQDSDNDELQDQIQEIDNIDKRAKFSMQKGVSRMERQVSSNTAFQEKQNEFGRFGQNDSDFFKSGIDSNSKDERGDFKSGSILQVGESKGFTSGSMLKSGESAILKSGGLKSGSILKEGSILQTPIKEKDGTLVQRTDTSKNKSFEYQIEGMEVKVERARTGNWINVEEIDSSSKEAESSYSAIRSHMQVATSDHKDLATDGKVNKDSMNSQMLGRKQGGFVQEALFKYINDHNANSDIDNRADTSNATSEDYLNPSNKYISSEKSIENSTFVKNTFARNTFN